MLFICTNYPPQHRNFFFNCRTVTVCLLSSPRTSCYKWNVAFHKNMHTLAFICVGLSSTYIYAFLCKSVQNCLPVIKWRYKSQLPRQRYPHFQQEQVFWKPRSKLRFRSVCVTSFSHTTATNLHSQLYPPKNNQAHQCSHEP